jgi:hypothetical protein
LWAATEKTSFLTPYKHTLLKHIQMPSTMNSLSATATNMIEELNFSGEPFGSPPMTEVGGDLRTAALVGPIGKWGEALDGGFQLLPDLLLRSQWALQLTTIDLVVLLHLTMAWWEKDRPPFPRTTTIARRMGTSDRTVQRSLERLRKGKLINRIVVTDSNGTSRLGFDLSPLAARLQEIARADPLSERRRALRSGEAGVHTQPPAQAQ